MRSLFYCFLCISLLFISSCRETDNVGENSITLETNSEPKEGVQPFAQNIFSQFTNVRDFTINKDENEAYFTLQSPARELSVIMKIEKKNEVWQTPSIASFSGKHTDLEPFLAPDGLKLYFASNRPISKDSTNTKDYDIWYVERTQITSQWSEPINIGAPVNSELDEFYPSVASSNNLYFTCVKKELNAQDDIFMCEWHNGSYAAPVRLGEGVNTEGAEYNAFVAPDESYIIFGGWRRPDGLGSGDMYISHFENDSWTTAKNFGSTINSKYMEYSPFVVNDMLYFTSRRSSVSSKENGFTSSEVLFSELNKYDNGSSRIYSVDLNTVLNASEK